MGMEVGKLIDVASEDAPMNVESPRENEESSTNCSGDKVESSEDEEECSEEISESSEDEKESSDDDPYGASVCEDLDSNEESMDGNPNGPLFVKRLFNYKPQKLSRGPGLARVGGLRPVCRHEMNHGYCKKIAKFAVKKHNEEQKSLLEWIKTVGHYIKTMNGLMHFLTLEAKDENGSKLYRAQVYDLRDTYIWGLFKPAPESKRRNCEACGHALSEFIKYSNVEKEAEMARSKHGAKRKAQRTSDESCKEDNATRKPQHLGGYDEVSAGKGGGEEFVPLGAL